jgi:hypothetical protein
MKIIIRNVRHISKTAKIIANKYIIRFNPFEIKIIIINVKSLNLLNFRNQALPESIPGIILNTFNVKYKVKIISNTK